MLGKTQPTLAILYVQPSPFGKVSQRHAHSSFIRAFDTVSKATRAGMWRLTVLILLPSYLMYLTNHHLNIGI